MGRGGAAVFPRAELAASLAQGVARLAERHPDEPRLVSLADSPRQERLLDWLALLHRWNQAHNLTSVRSPAQMVVRHLLDCLVILPWVRGGQPLLDVGSGPGLPGAVLAIADPQLSVTLVDSNLKMTRFAELAAMQLGLGNIDCLRTRVEEMEDQRTWPQVVSRAFASLEDFLALAGPRCAPGGRMLAMKGRRSEALPQSLPPGWQVEEVVALNVPFLDAERHLVIIRKEEI
ncbi:MAG: 16S rRNA (guanine(527)-N(7))-methyltransferase RsmG [Halothiobacillaceae bacterium]